MVDSLDCACSELRMVDKFSVEVSVLIFFFFFKQKTAYEMLRSLVGSEMCIRDRTKTLICTCDCSWRPMAVRFTAKTAKTLTAAIHALSLIHI